MYELVKHRLVPDIDHPPPFKSRSQSYALQMLPVRLPGSKAQLRFEKVLPTSRYYVIPSEVEESQILIRKYSRPGLR